MPAPEPRKPSQPLPPKEQALFRKVVKLYEQKQYRNGLRQANAILRGHPEHGETLSMKGLILNCQGKREEARDFVKRGLRADINSHVCWHVYGLFHRSEKKYEEAIKAYRNALHRDKDNMQILRDLSLLQIQMRDLEGYKETRYTLLTLRPTQRASWIGYAMSYHLLREYDTALKILSEFIKGQTETKKANSFQPASLDFEHSELLLYQNMVLREAGKVSEALAHLNEHEFAIFDKTALLELKGQLHLAEGRSAVAAEVYRELVTRNPDNRAYYASLETCMDLGDREDAVDARLVLYSQFKTQFPRASVPQLTPLSFLKGSRFREEVEAYLIAGLRKGLPSLFHLVRNLYTNPDKGSVIGEIVINFKKELEASADQSAMVNGSVNGEKEEEEEVPTTLLWTYYFLSQHYDKLGTFSGAMVNGSVNGEKEEEEEVPTTLLWTYYFLSQHYDKLGTFSDAMVNGSVNGEKEEEEEVPTTLLWTYYFLSQHYDKLGTFSDAMVNGSVNGEKEEEEEVPTTLLWTYYFLSQHYDKLGTFSDAMVNGSVNGEKEEEEEVPTTLLWTYYFLSQHYDKLGTFSDAMVNGSVNGEKEEEEEVPTTLLWTYYFLSQHYDKLGTFSDAMVNGSVNGEKEEEEEVPTTLLWTYYFLSQHYDKLGEPTKALELINTALQHTPTLIELHTLKAKVYKHAGAFAEAVACTEEAQSLDTADRFINCKAAKYLLRDGQIEAAEAMAGKFTREGQEPVANLREMQCMWFEAESAGAFYRMGMLGHALRKCHEIDRHFADIEEDQFDFHTYCVRKMTLCSYVRLLRLEDTLRSHPFYYKAARLAVKIYLRLHDEPGAALESASSRSGMAPSDAEKRKAARKARKQEAKQEQERQAKAGKAEKLPPEKKDAEEQPTAAAAPLDPAALLKVDKPLDEAVRFLMPLIELKTNEIDAYILGFHVYWRKEKVLRMTQCLRRAQDLEPLYPKLHVCKIRMLMFLDGKSWDGAVGEILSEELSVLFGTDRDPLAANVAFASGPGATSFPHLLAAAEAGVLLRSFRSGGGGAEARGVELVKAVLKAPEAPPGSAMEGLTLKSLVRAWKALQRGRLGPGLDALVLERFRESAAARFPLAEAFQLPEQRRLARLALNPPPPDPPTKIQGEGVSNGDGAVPVQ